MTGFGLYSRFNSFIHPPWSTLAWPSYTNFRQAMAGHCISETKGRVTDAQSHSVIVEVPFGPPKLAKKSPGAKTHLETNQDVILTCIYIYYIYISYIYMCVILCTCRHQKTTTFGEPVHSRHIQSMSIRFWIAICFEHSAGLKF